MAWTSGGDVLYFAMTMAARGWAGLGIAAELGDRKQGFDQYVFIVQDGVPTMLDMYQAASRNAPKLDEDEGGVNSIVLASTGVNP